MASDTFSEFLKFLNFASYSLFISILKECVSKIMFILISLTYLIHREKHKKWQQKGLLVNDLS